ncbi:hypothetical protein JCM8547_003608 [Rhodosporidiobolus lusitaniae]
MSTTFAAPPFSFQSMSSAFPPSPSSSSPPANHQPHYAPAAVDEDDLLALLGSDAFSLESRRDRDLLSLTSFLHQSFQPPASSAAGLVPQGFPASLGQAAAQGGGGGGGAGWNGWRPSGSGGGGEGTAAPYGSPMSFSSPGGVPPAPSSSLNTNPAFAYPSPAQTAFLDLTGSPSSSSPSSQHLPSPRRGSLSSRGRAPTSFGVPPPSTRAPACSRERVPTLSSVGSSAGGGGGGALPSSADEMHDGGGWKSRLRSAKALAQQDEDMVME